MTQVIESQAVATLSASDLPEIGAPFEGGFFGGQVKVGVAVFAIIWAPKAIGETRAAWLPSYDQVPNTASRSDSMANTIAMAEAGSPAGIWARGLSIAGHSDWCVPARDVLELAYRHFKPTTEENFADGEDGVNESSVPLGEAYTEESPAQTEIAAFVEGGDEAFEETWYWSSTQYSDAFAWSQYFCNGLQDNYNEKFAGAVRAVRLIQLTT